MASRNQGPPSLFPFVLLLSLLLALVPSFLLPFASAEEYHFLSIGESKIRGVLVKDNETATPVVSFRGLRYAEAPIGERRWTAPIEKELQLDHLVDATTFGSPCPQTQSAFVGPPNEDCLFLNIWTPNVIDKRPKEGLLPVMFFIHGGAFYIGSGHDPYIDGTRLAAVGRVVVVSINYRLGFLGFLAHPELTAADPKHPTNFGLLDQRCALKWLQFHITMFGGDPSKITIFGESAGAMSVMWHLIANTQGQRLFQRAIIQSSAATYPADELGEAEKAGEELTKQLKCDITQRDSNKYKTDLDCLRHLSMEELVLASIFNPYTKTYRRSVLFHSLGSNPKKPMPVVDGITFPDHIIDALKEGKYDTTVDVIIGSTEDEGTLFTQLTFPFISPSDALFRTITNAIFSVVKDPKQRDELVDVALRRYYYHNPRGPTGVASHNDSFVALSAMLGHIFFTCPTQHAAKLLADNNKSLRSDSNPLKRFGRIYNYLFSVKGKNLPHLGSFHASELPYVFGSTPGGLLFPASFSPEESKISKNMIEAWTSFAATGVPTFTTAKGLASWPELDSKEEYLLWTNANPEINKSYLIEDCEFWAPIYGEVSYVDIDELATEPLWSIVINGYVLAWLRFNRNQFLAGLACVFSIFAITFYQLVRACCGSGSKKPKRD